MKYNINDLVAKANSVSLPTAHVSHGGGNVLSFGIVCSASNGKRLSFSKALADHLALDDTAYITPLVEEGLILITGKPVFNNAYECGLRGSDKKLSYRANVVNALIDSFSLDFGTHVSRAFNKIEIFEHNGVPVASIQLTEPANTESDGANV